MANMILLSDLHLSPTHGFFWENWRIARDAVNAAAPVRVIVNGDLCIDGPDSDAEIAFAAEALCALRPKVRALPGNHDVGDEPPGQDPRQLITPARIARWRDAFGADRFCLDVGAWRLIGLNAQLFGSGLPQEEEQEHWLSERLACAADPTALILHKPLFLDSPEETELTTACMPPAPRARLLKLLRESPVRMVISGHLHAHRDVVLDGIRYVWAPALAFIHAEGHHGATPRIAAMSFDFTMEDAGVAVLDLPGLVAHDLDVMKAGTWRFLRDMPPCPPPIINT